MLEIGNRAFSDEYLRKISEEAQKREEKEDREVDEIEEMLKHSPIDLKRLPIIEKVFYRIFKKANSEGFAALSVYQLGYIYGKREERKKKEAHAVEDDALISEVIADMKRMSEKNLRRLRSCSRGLLAGQSNKRHEVDCHG